MILFTLIINIHIACKVFQLFTLLLAEAFYIILPNYGSKKKNDKRFSPFVALPSKRCRNEATRTPDPYVPNVVRYQLRYIPSLLMVQI